MAYIGQAPINGFHAKQQLTGDGSTVTFTLDQTVATETGIIVSVGGVLQEPSTAYNLTVGGTKITFTEAPASTDRVYIHYLGKAIVQNVQDVNGAEFVLDANGNTSLTADTDDEIDIKVGGSDRSTIKATGFHNLDNIKFVAGTGDDMQMYHDGTNSYLTNSEGALKIATETSGIAVTIGHSTSEVTIADNATVTGNLTVTGTLTQTGTQTFDGGIDVDNFNINGTTIALSSGDMTVDVAGDIILDADGGDIFFKDAGTTFGSATNTSGNLIIKSGTTTALTFAGANATLAGTLGVGAVTSTGIVTGTAFTAGSAVLAEAELELLDGLTAGTAIASKVVTTDANIDTTGQRNLTISGELDAATGDFSGDVDIDGTLEADAITVNGTALASVIAGTTVNLATLASTVTITDNENTDENNAIIFTAGGDVDGGSLGLESDGDLTYNPSSGTLNVPNISVTGTQTIVNSVTMNASNAVIFEGATADAHETTLSTVDATADRTINLPNQSGTLPVLAAASATAITSTPEELNKLDGATVTVGEINLIDGGATVGTTAFADGDGLLHNDNGTMRVTSATTLKTYMSDLTLTTAAQTNITSLGTLTALTVDNMAFNGNTLTTTSSDFIVDATHDIVLNADGAQIKFADASVTYGEIANDSSDFVLQSAVQDKDIVFKGDDGGAAVTALTLDMSAAGDAIFGNHIRLADSKKLVLGTGGDTEIYFDATNFLIDTEGDIILDANGADIILKDNGTVFGQLSNDSGYFDIKSTVSDQDISFKGNDGGSEITALRLDMSAAGYATFNAGVVAKTYINGESGNVTLDFATNQNFVLTLSGNITLVNPTTETVGQSGMIVIIQDGTGSRTLAVGDQYFGAGGEVPTISTAANSIDVIPYFVQAARKILLGSAQLAFADAS